MNDHRHIVLVSFRLVVSVTFIVSGLLKGVDPYGTSLKIQEYLYVFGVSLPSVVSDVLSIALCGGELTIGLCLLLGLRIKLMLVCAMFVLSFFTVVTTLSGLVPRFHVAECGCFGELIPMSARASLVKNLVLVAMTAVCLYLHQGGQGCVRGEVAKMLLTVMISFAVPVCNTAFLPVLDLGGYSIGTDLRDKGDFCIVDSKYNDVASDICSADRCILVVQKTEFSKSQLARMEQWHEDFGIKIAMLSYGELPCPHEHEHYLCSSNLLKSIVRSSGNSAIVIENGIIVKKMKL